MTQGSDFVRALSFGTISKVDKVKLSVIIPVYNESRTLEELLRRVLSSNQVDEVIVVDDYSSDGSREILQKFEEPKVKVFFQPYNQGKGAAIKLGLEKVRGDYVIVQDADLEYSPSDYQKLVTALDQNHPIIFGSRFKNTKPKILIHSYLANLFLTYLTNLLFGSSLTDMASCYKLIPTKILRDLDLKSNRFEVELEITAKLLSQNIPIREIPISFKGRNYGEGKKITWRDGARDLWLLFKYRFWGFG